MRPRRAESDKEGDIAEFRHCRRGVFVAPGFHRDDAVAVEAVGTGLGDIRVTDYRLDTERSGQVWERTDLGGARGPSDSQ